MPESSVIVWDLETIADLPAAARMLNMVGASDDEVRKALGPEFPIHPLHKIVCIGALVASSRPEGWQIDALGAPNIGERSEAELIAAFIERVGSLGAQLVTFNGNNFDLPVLRYRAMVHRISGAGLQVRSYFHRYTDDALDLCDALASYSYGAKVKLDQITKIIGLPGKPPGLDGARVQEMVCAGQIDEVSRYCETDVLNTYRLWLLYELFRGALTSTQANWSETHIREFVLTRKMANPYLRAAVDLGST